MTYFIIYILIGLFVLRAVATRILGKMMPVQIIATVLFYPVFFVVALAFFVANLLRGKK